MPELELHPAAAYYRVSSKDQDLALQEHAVAQAAAAAGFVITSVYSEKRSAKTTARPELQRLREDARAGRLPPRLFVFRYDRLVRSGITDMLMLVRDLSEAGVQIVSCTDGFALSGPTGELVLAGLAFASQIERLAGEERRAAARTARQAKGLAFGRPPRMTAAQLALAQVLHKEGRSYRSIAQAVKVPTKTVERTLKRAAALVCHKSARKATQPL